MRTVKVGLEADVAGYIGGVLEAEKATGSLDRKVEDLDGDLKKIPADSAKAAAGLETLGAAAKDLDDDYAGAAKSTEGFSEKTRASGDETGKLESRISELKTSVRDLGAEFDRSGDPALLKKFRADSSELSGLMKMRKEVQGLKDDLEEPLKTTGGGSGNIAELFSGGLTSPGALGIGAAALGPALAAAGGAIGAIGGAAGAGLGIYGAVLGNPQAFKSAWSAATGEVKKDLIDAGAAFTGPALDAIKTIGPTISSWHLDQALAPAAKYVPVLVSGLEKAATGFEHGFADLVANAGPEVQVLSDGMAQFGNAVGTAFTAIASGSQGGAQALHDTITLVSDLTIALGETTGAAEKAFGAIHDHPILAAIGTGGLTIPISIWDAIAGSANKASDATTSAGEAAAKAGPDFAALSTELNKTKVDADSLAETMSLKVLNSMMGIDRATLSFDQALLSVATSVKQNGHALDEHTTKGLANRQMILSLVQANIAEYKANVDAGMGAEQAASAYDAGTAALNRQLRAAGFNQAAIDGMIGKYKQVPKNVDTKIAIDGLTAAINDLDDLIRQLNGLPSRKDITIYTHTGSVGGKESGDKYSGSAPTSKKPMQYNASGGFPDAGWGWAGEEGPELINWSGRERVFSASESRSMMAASNWSGSGGYSGPVAVTLQMAPGASLTPLGSLFNQMLRDGLIVVKASQVRPA